MSVLDKLDIHQREVVLKSIDKSTLLMANAGSGKTSTMTSRYIYLLNELDIPIYDILAITFTNKAANELKERIGKYLSKEQLKRTWIGTFHSICIRLLHLYGNEIGLNKFTIMDPDDSKALIVNICERRLISTEKMLLRNNIIRISELKNSMITPDIFAPMAGDKDHQLLLIYDEYEQYLTDHNILDFDNIILKVVYGLQNNKVFSDKIKNKFKYIMSDEFQDSNISQYMLIKLLTGSNNVFMVGDIKQSIYGWRQAKPELFDNFLNDYKNSQVLELNNNYRSTGNIINGANSVIAKNVMKFKNNMTTKNGIGETIKILQYDNSFNEADGIAANIKILHNSKDIRWGDIAILYRTNYQSRSIEQGLKKAFIPYKIISGTSFFERKEIKDMVAYLKFFVNELDDLSLKRILLLNDGVGKVSATNLFNEAIKTNSSLIYKIRESKNKRIKEFYNKLSAITDNIDESIKPSTIIQIIIDNFLYNILDLKDDNYEDRLGNIEEFKNLAIEYETTTEEPKLEEFVERVSLHSDSDNIDDADNCVKLITGHSSKGTEYSVVFIVNAEEGFLPHKNSSKDPTKLEEERRIFFVMMTRAKEYLYITHARNRRSLTGNMEQTIVSRYLNDIPKECSFIKVIS